MKNNFFKWIFVAFYLIFVMTGMTFVGILLGAAWFCFFEGGKLNISLQWILFMSLKLGVFLGLVMTAGIWLQTRFNLR